MKTMLWMMMFLAVSVFAEPADKKWEEVDSEDGIKVYSREIPGSSLVSFRGTGIIDAPVSKVIWVLADNEHRHEWTDRLAVSRNLEKITPYDFVIYQAYDMPFIFSDRDFVYRGKGSRDPKTGKILIHTFSVEHKDAPKTMGVRGELKNSLYVLESIENGTKTYVDVELLLDPKGYIPKWMVNMIQKSWPLNTLKGIRKQVKKPFVKDYPLPKE